MPCVPTGTDRGGADEHACRMPRELPGRSNALRASRAQEEQTMLDILMLALGAGFFALAIGYTYACERL